MSSMQSLSIENCFGGATQMKHLVTDNITNNKNRSPLQTATLKRRRVKEGGNNIQASYTQTINEPIDYPTNIDPNQIYHYLSDQVINNIIANLSLPNKQIQVAQDYANHKTSSFEVQAYAKLAGSTWTYFVKQLQVTIGRFSEPFSENIKRDIDIDLGPSKVVSRKHATIRYNCESQTWEIVITGRNGVKIDRIIHKDGIVRLYSGNILDIGGVQMMFVLPDSKPRIASNFIPESQDSRNNYPYSFEYPSYQQHSETSLATRVSPSRVKTNIDFHSQQAQSQSQPILFRPHSTFNNIHSNSTTDSTPQYSTLYPKGVHMVSRPQVRGVSQFCQFNDYDLSLDDAKDIKPPYSYATIITKAILSSEDNMMTLSEIYDWISRNYSFYRHSKTGWQNSIRHNLSLNKSFQKVPRRSDEPGKGMKWQVAPEYKEQFLRKFKIGEITKTQPKGTLMLQPNNNNNNNKESTIDHLSRQLAPLTQKVPSPVKSPPSLQQQLPSLPHPQSPPQQHPPGGENIHLDMKEFQSPVYRRTSSMRVAFDCGVKHENSNLDSTHFEDVIHTPQKDQYGDVCFEHPPLYTKTPSPSHCFRDATFTPDRLPNVSASRSTVNLPALTSQTPAPIAQNLQLAPPSSAQQQQLPSSFMPSSSPAPFWRFMQLSSTPIRDCEGFSPMKYQSPTVTTNLKTNKTSISNEDGLGDLQDIDLARGFRNSWPAGSPKSK